MITRLGHLEFDETVNRALFASYARDSLDLWRELIGERIVHALFGEGTILDLQLSPSLRQQCLFIQFSHELRHFKVPQVGHDPYVHSLTLSVETQKRIRRLAEGRDEQRRRPEAVQYWLDERRRMAKAQGQERKDRRWRIDQLLSEDERLEAEVARRHTRKLAIQQICSQRGIDKLVHFTKLINLAPILREGLLPRVELETRATDSAFYNDPLRLDQCKNAVCLSVSHPNYKTFWQFRGNRKYKWAVIALDPTILWELDCAFCVENAASRNIRNIPLYERKQANSLARLFEDYQSDYMTVGRNTLNIPDNYPTHPQAEVLAFGRIVPQYIRAIYLDPGCARVDRRILDAAQDAGVALAYDEYYFRSRADYRHWQRRDSARQYNDDLWAGDTMVAPEEDDLQEAIWWEDFDYQRGER